jgi:hypothetical protein
VRRRRRRGRRVVTPDGYVWFVRRRRARRRPPWARRDPRRSERFHDEEELVEEPPGLPLSAWVEAGMDDLARVGGSSLDDVAGSAVLALGVVLAAVGALVWLTVRFVLPWVVPLVQANARLLLGLAAALAVLVALNQVHRPWYVELQRQGLADAPRRVWRVQGWRRSGRLIAALTAAIREGRVDHRGAVILPADDRR